MTDEFTGCVYHTVEVLGPDRFKVEVYVEGTMTFEDFDETGEATFHGGRKVATLYRATEDLAHGAGIAYSFVTSGPDKFRGVTNPDYGKGRKRRLAEREEI